MSDEIHPEIAQGVSDPLKHVQPKKVGCLTGPVSKGSYRTKEGENNMNIAIYNTYWTSLDI